MKQHRQGDIFFESSKKNPTSQTRKMTNNVIAYGEVTGHAHTISSPSLDELDACVDEKGNIWLRSSDKAITISHDEHGDITLDPGTWWNVTRQREYDPIEDEIRVVRD